MGINPIDFSNMDVEVSFQLSNARNHEDIKYVKNKTFMERIVIDENNRYYLAWKIIVIFLCVISSYFYAYMAAFRAPEPGEDFFSVMLFFEISFFIDICLKFLVSFTKDGETIPTRDLSKIGWRYLNKGFIFDFIPLIPFPNFLDIDHRE
jgi:hypothetical protein